MATTQNTYTGNGSTTNYSFTFEYLKQSDVKVTLDTVATTAFTFANATTLSFTTAPANGVAIRIFRDTAIDLLSATFFPGSAIKAEDLNQNFTQSLYVTQESDADAAAATTTANTAKTTADTALADSATAVTTANAATATANTADTNASAAVVTANAASATATTASTDAASAVTTANTASTNASAAVTTANSAATDAATAITTANGAVTTANSATTAAAAAQTTANNAVTTANSAVTTANTANTTAGSAVTTANSATSTANTANTNATNAVSIANAASAAVSNAVLFTLVANVAAIPGSPSNNDYIEIGDSTGIESFSPLSSLPSGFVGASGLTVRLRYDTSATSWVYMSYFANDSEDRYFTKASGNTNTTNIATNVTNIATNATDIATNVTDIAAKMPLAGGTFTGAVSFDDNTIIKGDATNGSGKLTLNCENNSHGVHIKGPPHSAAATYTLTLPNDAGTNGQSLTTNGSGTLTWTTQATDSISEGNTSAEVIDTGTDGRFVVTTEGSEALRVDSSGRLLVGSTSAYVSDANFQVTDDTNAKFVISNPGNATYSLAVGTDNALAFKDESNTLERIRIDSSGNVGIGTDNTNVRLNISGNSAATQAVDIFAGSNNPVQLALTNGYGARQGLVYGNSGSTGYTSFGIISENTALTFKTAAYNIGNTSDLTTGWTERMRIDSSGRLLVGTSSSRQVGDRTHLIQIEGNSSGDGGVSMVRNLNDDNATAFTLAKTRSTSVGGTTIVQNGDKIGELAFAAADGSDVITRAATIRADVDGTPGANDMPGRLVFSTTADGASSPTERMRIDRDGNVSTFGQTNNILARVSGSGTSGWIYWGAYGATSTQDGTQSFGVYANGNVVNTNNSYGAISDIKLKENIVDANSQWNDLKALQVRNYNFKEGQTHTQIGLVAQEVELVSPGLVSESPDRDEEGNDLGTVTKSVNYSVLYMKAVKALQEAMERIETLEQRLTDAGL